MFMISVTRRRCWKLVGVLLAAYGGIAGVAAAEIDAAPPQQVVRFGDLNLRDSGASPRCTADWSGLRGMCARARIQLTIGSDRARSPASFVGESGYR